MTPSSPGASTDPRPQTPTRNEVTAVSTATQAPTPLRPAPGSAQPPRRIGGGRLPASRRHRNNAHAFTHYRAVDCG